MGEYNSRKDRVVIGIDPASGGKGSYVFAPTIKDPDPQKANGSGIDRPMSPLELRALLPSRSAREECSRKPFGTESCLVCWDAPLTGLQDPDGLLVRVSNEGVGTKKDNESLTTRPIERTGNDSKYPEIAKASEAPGVSVLGFSGLSHWVITRNVLGLPRVGRFDAEYKELPLYPVFSKEELDGHDWAVTEVHPTLAAYIWLHASKKWRPYKGGGISADETRQITKELWEQLEKMHPIPHQSAPPRWSDDAFDARVAWLLGYLWLQGDTVVLVGSEQDGSFLLPKDETASN